MILAWVWVKCYLNRRKLQRLLASAELPSEHPLEEQIKNSIKKKISVESKCSAEIFYVCKAYDAMLS